MSQFNQISRYALGLLATLLVGCTHLVEVAGDGEGDIHIRYPISYCTYEQQQCGILALGGGSYGQRLEARARPGSIFGRWDACTLKIEEPYVSLDTYLTYCEISVAQEIVETQVLKTWGPTTAFFFEKSQFDLFVVTSELFDIGTFPKVDSVLRLGSTTTDNLGFSGDFAPGSSNIFDAVQSIQRVGERLFVVDYAGSRISELYTVEDELVEVRSFARPGFDSIRMTTFDGKLYIASRAGQSVVFEVDLDTGAAVPAIPLIQEGPLGALVFGPGGELYYSGSDVNSTPQIFIVDKTTGATQALNFNVSPIPYFSSFTWVEGQLIGLSSNGALYAVDLENSSITFIKDLAVPDGWWASSITSRSGELEPRALTEDDLTFDYLRNDLTIGSADQTGNQAFSYKINSRTWDDSNFLIEETDRDANRIVRPIAPGIIHLIDPSLGRVVVKHTYDLKLADGSVLDTWYSDYRHMIYTPDPVHDVGERVTQDSGLGRISNIGSDQNQLHLAILRDLDTNTPASAVDIANQLPGLPKVSLRFVNQCDGNFNQPALWNPWWSLGQLPCP